MLFASWSATEFDVEVDMLVGQVRSLRLPFLDDEQQSVVGEQRDVVVDRPVVAVEIPGKRRAALGRAFGRQQRSQEFDPAVGEDLPQLTNRTERALNSSPRRRPFRVRSTRLRDR